jgi:RNA polymerase sigma-70 factor (ECF subfamily)
MQTASAYELPAPANEATTAGPRTADEAMADYAAGDGRAFDQVYAFIAPRLTSYLRRRMRDQARVPDLVQQTFLNMHRARRTFIAGAEVLPWAFAIARRQLVDAYRAAEREELPARDAAESAALTCAPAGDELLAAKEAARRFERALAGLSRPQRDAFELVKGDGLSLVEAAAALGTTVTGVKLRTHRAYAALREALSGPPHGGVLRRPGPEWR